MANTIYTTLGNNEGYGSAEFSSKIFTNRTSEDVAFALLNPDYPFPAKGAYNAADFNRIEEAFTYLRSKMNSEYGFNLNLTIKTDWTKSDNITESNIEAYRQNVATIRSAITVTSDTPETPSTIRFMTAQKANDIEKILQAVEVLLDNISAAWFYSGEIYSGEVF